MRINLSIATMFAAIGLTMMARGTDAAPISSNVQAATSTEATAVENAAYRRCWRRNGVTCCRWYGEGRLRGYRARPRYYEYDANRLPFGTSRWWEQMEREGRAGRRR